MSMPIDFSNNKEVAASFQVMVACNEHDVRLGTHGIYDHPTMQKCIGIGTTLHPEPIGPFLCHGWRECTRQLLPRIKR